MIDLCHVPPVSRPNLRRGLQDTTTCAGRRTSSCDMGVVREGSYSEGELWTPAPGGPAREGCSSRPCSREKDARPGVAGDSTAIQHTAQGLGESARREIRMWEMTSHVISFR